MKKEKIILQLGVEIDSLKAHIQRLKKDSYQPHPLDVELLQQKTRQLYDLLFELEDVIGQQEEAVPLRIKQEEKPQKKGTDVPEQKSIMVEPAVVETVQEKIKVVEEVPEIPLTEEKTILPGTPSETPKAKKITEEKMPEPQEEFKKPEPKPKIETQKPAEVKSTFDLFSDNTTATVGDKFTGREESLADKMQHSRVSDLRQSIGINEKFLFINELFNGDLGRYNKTVDELNALTTLKGMQTFLMEIKIQHQWDEGLEAYQKLKDLAERKFK